MNKFFEAFLNVFRVPDLRWRVFFTLAMLAVYRVGAHIPTPGVNTAELERLFEQAAGTALGFLDLFSGGQLSQLTIFALGIMPYITASIILQLLTIVVPTLEKLQKEGELGRRKITQWTRYLTIALSVAQSIGFAGVVESSGLAYEPGWGFRAMTVLTLTTGTAFVMWLGEQITERGIGNGMSLLIFAGIVVGLPGAIQNLYENVFVTQQWNLLQLVLILVAMVARGRVHRARGARRTANPGAVRTAYRGPPPDGRPTDPFAAESEFRRCHAGHLCVFDSGLPADLGSDRPG